MNIVSLIGRLTKEPEVRYGASNQMAIARFSIAIDRGKDRNGNNAGTDYPSIVCFGKIAELVEKYIKKGHLVGIQGKIQTSSYEKDGHKVYITEVIADRVEFLEKKESSNNISAGNGTPEGFNLIDDDLPF